MLFDIIANRSEFLKLSDDEVHETLSTMFPDQKLYSHSIDWRKDEQYILKAKGGRGDVLVGWGNITEGDETSELIGSLRCRTLKSILGHRSEKGKGNQGSAINRK